MPLTYGNHIYNLDGTAWIYDTTTSILPNTIDAVFAALIQSRLSANWNNQWLSTGSGGPFIQAYDSNHSYVHSPDWDIVPGSQKAPYNGKNANNAIVSSIVKGNPTTINTNVPHYLVTGDQVTFSGFSPSGLNGTWTIGGGNASGSSTGMTSQSFTIPVNSTNFSNLVTGQGWISITSCISEGLGYGMLAAAIIGDKTNFDKLWNWAKGRIQLNNYNGGNYNLVNWRWDVTNNHPAWWIYYTGGSPVAPDGDEDMAYALIRAGQVNQWGASYITDGYNIAQDILRYSVETTDGSKRILSSGIDLAWNYVVNTRSFYPDYFHAPLYNKMVEIDPANALVWSKVNSDCYYFKTQAATNLCGGKFNPDQATVSANSTTVVTGGDDNHQSEASRQGWRDNMNFQISTLAGSVDTNTTTYVNSASYLRDYAINNPSLTYSQYPSYFSSSGVGTVSSFAWELASQAICTSWTLHGNNGEAKGLNTRLLEPWWNGSGWETTNNYFHTAQVFFGLASILEKPSTSVFSTTGNISSNNIVNAIPNTNMIRQGMVVTCNIPGALASNTIVTSITNSSTITINPAANQTLNGKTFTFATNVNPDLSNLINIGNIASGEYFNSDASASANTMANSNTQYQILGGLSPNGYKFQQYTSANQPTLTSSGINSQNTLTFNGTSQFMTLSADLSSSFTLTGSTHSNTTIDTLSSSTGILIGQTISGSGIPSPTFTGNTTINSQTIAVANTTGIQPGMTVSGTGIPANATVTVVTTNTSITISSPCTATNTGVTITRGVIITGFSGGVITLSDAATATASGVTLTIKQNGLSLLNNTSGFLFATTIQTVNGASGNYTIFEALSPTGNTFLNFYIDKTNLQYVVAGRRLHQDSVANLALSPNNIHAHGKPYTIVVWVDFFNDVVRIYRNGYCVAYGSPFVGGSTNSDATGNPTNLFLGSGNGSNFFYGQMTQPVMLNGISTTTKPGTIIANVGNFGNMNLSTLLSNVEGSLYNKFAAY